MTKVQCPICKGIAGINVAIEGAEDWYDCDFCDATGEVNEQDVARLKDCMGDECLK